MKYLVLSIKEQSYKGNKMYKFTLYHTENKSTHVTYYEPREVRSLRDHLNLNTVSELEGIIIEFNEPKAA